VEGCVYTYIYKTNRDVYICINYKHMSIWAPRNGLFPWRALAAPGSLNPGQVPSWMTSDNWPPLPPQKGCVGRDRAPGFLMGNSWVENRHSEGFHGHREGLSAVHLFFFFFFLAELSPEPQLRQPQILNLLCHEGPQAAYLFDKSQMTPKDRLSRFCIELSPLQGMLLTSASPQLAPQAGCVAAC